MKSPRRFSAADSGSRSLDVTLRSSVIIAVVAGALLTAGTLCVAADIPIPGDMALVRLAVQTRTPSLTFPLQVLTFISSSIPALAITVIATAGEAWRRKRLDPGAAWALAAFLGFTACNIALRLAIGRQRPAVDYIPNAWPELRAGFQRFSYPSGHAGAALIAYTSLLVLAWPWRVWRPLVAAGVVLIVGGVGFARVYLGVHWPSDVAAGYLLAGIWLCGGLALRRGCPAAQARYNFRAST
jgi:membrane-associated phospholipid phosphatase